jgi:hypothetical protein
MSSRSLTRSIDRAFRAALRALLPRRRETTIALVLLFSAFGCLGWETGAARAAEVPNGLTITPKGMIKEKTAAGECRAGAVTEISGPGDLVKAITEALTAAESHLPAGTVTSHEIVNGKLRVTAYHPEECTADKQGVLVWLRPALGEVVYTATYVAVSAAVLGFGYLYLGLPITDPGIETLAGCLSAGVALAVNNAFSGLTTWREIVASTITGCLIATSLSTAIMRAGYYFINAMNWYRGQPAITYELAVGEVAEVAGFAAQRMQEVEAQYRIPPPE